jgi:hyaluronate lyase
VFLDSTNVTSVRETNDKPLKEILSTANENIRYQASYFKMYISHGSNPAGAAYAYLTLPGKSASETAAYAANVDSHITVLSNTADVQAIESGDIVAMSVFSSSGGSVTASGGGTYRVDKQALVQVKKLDGSRYSIAVSYPLHAEGTVTLTLPFTVTAGRMDSGVSVNGNKVTVSSNNIGSSYTVEVTAQ